MPNYKRYSIKEFEQFESCRTYPIPNNWDCGKIRINFDTINLHQTPCK